MNKRDFDPSDEVLQILDSAFELQPGEGQEERACSWMRRLNPSLDIEERLVTSPRLKCALEKVYPKGKMDKASCR